MPAYFPLGPVLQRPGLGPTDFDAQFRIVMRAGRPNMYAGGGVIDGSKSRDVLTASTWPFLLRPGLLMGKLTSNGRYAPSVIGTITGAYTSGGTTLNVSAAQAAELVRRVGSSGTFKTTGPPAAAGVVAVTTTTFSAVNTATGDITVTSLGVNKIAGSLIQVIDGSETPLTFVPDGIGILLDDTPTTTPDVNFPEIPMGCSTNAVVSQGQLLPAATDTSILAFYRTSLQAVGPYVFDNVL